MLKKIEYQQSWFYVFSKSKLNYEQIAPAVMDRMCKDPGIKIASVRLACKNRVVDNFRNFPAIFDLLVKNIPFLRTRFPQRMRRYLLWDLDTTSVKEVDWLTNDLLFINASFYDQNRLDLTIPHNDVQLCARAWQKKFRVTYFGDIVLSLGRRRRPKNLLEKFAILSKALIFKISNLSFLQAGGYPSYEAKFRLERVHKANILEHRSFVSKLGASFQKRNPVIQIYDALIESDTQYRQPLVFWKPGAVALLENEKSEIGLIKIWRHAPLQDSVLNIFPVLPDMSDLGGYFWELIRGGSEKQDLSPIESALRECAEEITLHKNAVISSQILQEIIPNSASDISKMHIVHIKINSKKLKVKLQKDEHIADFQWFTKSELHDIIKQGKIQCSITLAGLIHVLYV